MNKHLAKICIALVGIAAGAHFGAARATDSRQTIKTADPKQAIKASDPRLAPSQPRQTQAEKLSAKQQAIMYKERGETACDEGNYPQAVTWFTYALGVLPYDTPQNLADLYYARAIAHDVTGQYQRGTADWQAARDNYAKALLGDKTLVNIPFATGYKEDLTDMLHWRAAQNPNASDYVDAVHVKRFEPGVTLKVFINESKTTGFAPDLKALIFQAMNLWCQFPGSPIRMELSPTQYNAHISVQRAPVSDSMNTGGAGQTVNPGRELMTKSSVNLSAPGYSSKDMSPRAKAKLFNLALHETGHALGIDGHSPSGLDVMYFKSPLLKLSDRDANTIRKIYQ